MSLADYIQDLEKAIETLTEKPILIGHSMGGFITQKYLEQHPAKAGVLIASIPPKGFSKITARAFKMDFLSTLKNLLTMNISPANFDKESLKKMMFTPGITDAQYETYYSKLQPESFRAYLDFDYLTAIDVNKIKTPLFIIGAEQDSIIPPHEAQKMANLYHTEAKIYPNMPHNLMLAKGYETVAKDILSWLETSRS